MRQVRKSNEIVVPTQTLTLEGPLPRTHLSDLPLSNLAITPAVKSIQVKL